MWCYLVIGSFDWKIGIFQQAVVRGYCILKAKIKEFNGVVNTNFWGDKVPKEGVHHTCKACIGIDSIMKMEKKRSYPPVYLEECKYKIKKTKMSGFDSKLL